MEGHKNKITVLVAKINRINEENQKLKSMLDCAYCRYNHLQKHIRPMLQQCNGVDGSQIFNQEHRSKDILCGRSINSDSSSVISHQSAEYWDGREQGGGGREKKNVKFMDDQQLPSKKRNNGMINSSIEQMDDLPKKKLRVMTKGFGQHTAAAAKRTLSVQTRSEASAINDGCEWRKYGQKMTRNNQRPRSYYRCVMAPGCPVKKQVQRCAQDPTIVITTYKGEHTHLLSPLAIAAMHASSNQLISEGLNIPNFVADNQFIPFSTAIARISTPSPSITLNATDNRPDRPGLQLQPAHLKDSVASIKENPNFSTSLAVAIAGSLVNLGAPVQVMSKTPHATHFTDGSTQINSSTLQYFL